MRVVAGCDGGGSKCAVRVVVLERGKTVRIGNGVAGPANVSSDLESAVRNVRRATNAALTAVGLSEGTLIDRFVVALAGASSFGNEAELRRRLADGLTVGDVQVEADAAVLFTAANVVGPAVALIVGTGSIAWSRDASGAIVRAGGLGPDVGDEGSGYWIGRKAVDAKLLPSVAESNTQAIAGLASSVFEDERVEAKQIIDSAETHIADLLRNATQSMETTRISPLAWVCGGGVAVHQTQWLSRIRSRCAASGLFLTEPVIVAEPVVGAVRLAM